MKRSLLALLLALLAPAAGTAAEDAIGSVKAMDGPVLLRDREGDAFAPAKVGQPLFGGGTVLVMEDASATLALTGRKDVTLDDNVALNLRAFEGQGEFAAVTGVRAPVLFLHPTGATGPRPPGTLQLAFGIHHGLESIRAVKDFQVHALHEDAEDELPLDAPVEAVIEAARAIAGFQRPAKVPADGYAWYSMTSTVPLTAEGEYTLFVTAGRGKDARRLGESTLLVIEGPDEGEPE